MKTKSLTLVVLLCFCRICPASAQIQETFWHWQVIDTVRIYCVYDYVEYNVFRSNHLKEHELFCVEIGDRLSRYYSLKQLEGDSLFYTTPQAKREYQRRIRAGLSVKGDNKTNRLEKMGQIMPGGSEGEVYKNYPVQDSMLVYNGWHGRTKYTETMMPQAWEIHSDTMLFLGYTCQKATCRWRGRDYTAWFTEEIPVSDGPYKFYGLPGLIVSVEDATGEYSWQLQGVEMPANKRIYRSQPLNGKEYKLTDRLTELRQQWKSRLQMVKKVNADAVMLGKEPPETEEPYDLIELDYK